MKAALVLRKRGAAKALSSPVRVEILEKLHAAGPMSARALAAALSRTPHSLYYHLRLLAAAGAVLEDAKPGESVFRLAAEKITLPGSLGAQARARAASAAAGSILRRASRNFARSLERLGESEDELRAVGSRRARLDGAARREIEKLGARIEALLAAAEKRGQGPVHLFSFVIAPLHDARNRKKK